MVQEFVILWALATMDAVMRAPALSSSSAAWPNLAAGEVHLWWIRRERSVARALAARSAVSKAEHARALRMRNVMASENVLLQHHALREILGSYIGLPPHVLAFEFNPFGKPALAIRQPAPGAVPANAGPRDRNGCGHAGGNGSIAALARRS